MALEIHLDTDFGGDIDDACALALLLRWPGVEITGVTTSAEEDGRRAGYVRHFLSLEQKGGIPVAAGANSPLEHPYPDEESYWGARVAPSPNPSDEALLLLKRSIERGAVVAAVGPFTNLCLLGERWPGILRRARLFLMGGYVRPPREGFPQWGAGDDYNVQVDARSALYVLEHSGPTLVPISVTVETFLRRASLERLEKAGGLGRLLARQAEAFARDERMDEKFGEAYGGVPRDIINFQHDPLACAVALGWDEGVEISELLLKTELKDGVVRQSIDPQGVPTRVVTRVDGERFSEFWLDTVAGTGRA